MSLGKTSLDRLNTCHTDLQVIFVEVDNRLLLMGRDHVVFCGHRDKDAQEKAFAEGKSQKCWPDSKHNTLPSNAVDAGPYFKDLKNTDWGDRLAFSQYAGIVLATANELYVSKKVSHKLKWGGDWDADGRSNDHNWVDLPHFELVD